MNVYKTHAEGWTANSLPQENALSRSENEILYGGARGGGKTEAGLAWLVEPEYVNHPLYRSLVIRRDYEDLADWIFRAKIFYQGMCEIVGNPAIIKWRGGGVTRLGHWKDKNTIRKYIGQEYWKMLLEELTQSIDTLKEYKLLLGSLRIPEVIEREHPCIIPQVFATTNPGGPGHKWCREYWVDVAKKKAYIDPVSGYSRFYIPSKASDNPANSKRYVNWLNSLPEPLRSAWRDGSWESFEGQFFTEFGTHLREEPFEVPDKYLADSLFGSLDIGIAHKTSFGLYFRDSHNTIHRLMTYSNNGYTHRHHAEAIFEKISNFRWTGKMFPITIWVGPDAWTKTKINEWSITSPIQQYIEVFEGKCTEFVKANNDRQHGCWTMREAFRYEDGLPKFKYWKSYNTTFEDSVQAVIIDDNYPETYKKMSGDDEADDARYGLVGLMGNIAEKKQSERLNRNSLDYTPFNNDGFVKENYGDLISEINLA